MASGAASGLRPDDAGPCGLRDARLEPDPVPPSSATRAALTQTQPRRRKRRADMGDSPLPRIESTAQYATLHCNAIRKSSRPGNRRFSLRSALTATPGAANRAESTPAAANRKASERVGCPCGGSRRVATVRSERSPHADRGKKFAQERTRKSARPAPARRNHSNMPLYRAFRFCVAPMMDWTDRHCRVFHRLLTRRARLYTEMVTADAVVFGDRASGCSASTRSSIRSRCNSAARSRRDWREAARIGAEFGYDEINLNAAARPTGCRAAASAPA